MTAHHIRMRYIVFDDMTHCTADDVQRMLLLVSKERRETALRYKHLFGQWACLKVCELLLQLLDITPPLPDFRYNDHGKPYIPAMPEFSLSHCPEAVAAAVADTPVGIDIERMRHPSEALLRRVMNEQEQLQIQKAKQQDEMFIRLWTRKEALLKKNGTGIIDNLQDVLTGQAAQHISTFTSQNGKYVFSIAEYPLNQDNMKHLIHVLCVLLAISGCKTKKDDEPQAQPKPTVIEGMLNGKFTIGANRQISFSRGNLQFNVAQGTHTRADGTTSKGTWRFAENQWECIGTDNSNISDKYDGWIDLLSWGTSGWASGANITEPYIVSEQPYDYYVGNDRNNDLTGDYANADWGVYNAISNGGNQAGLWRTLTHEEWMYVFNQRENAEQLKGKAIVNKVPGYVLLPDNWDGSMDFVPKSQGFDRNTYTADEWMIMEILGAVFLPAAGYRNAKLVSDVAYSPTGLYWTSTASDATYAYALVFDNFYVYPEGSSHRSFGIAIRLVHDIQ
jgi:phosphopantetheine--protein transferase-like protein